MPTPHIDAQKGDIAETILLPGDPLRAKYIAENFLQNPCCFNTVRNMLGYTGAYKNNKISVMGMGMGMPSCMIYVHEFINEYGVKNLIRIGSAGGMQQHVKVNDIIIASGACTDSKINRVRFNDQDYAAIPSFELLLKAHMLAKEKNLNFHVGNIITSDTFYTENNKNLELFMNHGVLAVEMETAALYTLAAKFNVNALAIVTISDHLLHKTQLSAKEREISFTKMIELALDTAH